ncbi:hypothetical protein BpHYR1_045428 [Brachionus plicatilis]|uniref:Uncharacterized protein n=1 Tax=Brachionus plicatilis TaxID=10195 RepID=A0A3M7PKI6_BRAPC|nr:hypothetical protein BpHYR1_045428 [Brachionus plicatilis]
MLHYIGVFSPIERLQVICSHDVSLSLFLNIGEEYDSLDLMLDRLFWSLPTDQQLCQILWQNKKHIFPTISFKAQHILIFIPNWKRNKSGEED